jgi:hypothetical protein
MMAMVFLAHGNLLWDGSGISRKAACGDFQTDFLAADPHPFHVGSDVENIAVGHEKRRVLADFN